MTSCAPVARNAAWFSGTAVRFTMPTAAKRVVMASEFRRDLVNASATLFSISW